jgi:hypothetical protein
MASGAEPWIAVDPRDSLHAVVAAMVQSGGQVSHPWIGYAVTTDGGRTWSYGEPPGGPSDPGSPFAADAFGADAMVAFAADGTVVLALLAGLGEFVCSYELGACTPWQASVRSIDLVTWRSSDGGRTFSEGAVVDHQQGALFGLYPAAGAGYGGQAGTTLDREGLAADADTGTMVLAWTRITVDAGAAAGLSRVGLDLMASRSTDAGATWSEPQKIGDGLYGATVAGLNGTFLVTARQPYGEAVAVVRSTDGGATWSAPVEVAPQDGYDTFPVALWRAPSGLAAALAYPGSEGKGVYLRASGDGGATWASAEGPLFAGNATPRRLPVMAVDAGTGLGVLATFQQAGDPDQRHVWALGLDHGHAAGPALQVSENVTSRASGWDYFAAAAGGDQLYLAWGESGAYTSQIAAARLAWVSAPPSQPAPPAQP